MPILDLSIPLPHINFTVDMVDGVGGQELTFFLSHLMVLVNNLPICGIDVLCHNKPQYIMFIYVLQACHNSLAF